MPTTARLKWMVDAVSGLSARIPLPARQCLAVAAAEGEVRAALVTARGRTREIVDFVALKAGDPEEDLPAIARLREIVQRLNCRAGTPAVFVTPLVRLALLSMNRQRVHRMRSNVLSEAAKWEAEAYTGIPGNQGLAGVEVEQAHPEPGEIMAPDEEVQVQVAVLEQNIYRAARERFRLAGLKLRRIYPAELCFHIPLLDRHAASDRAVFDIGASSSGYALLRGGRVMSINTMNITAGMLRDHLAGRSIADLEDTLLFNFRQAPPPHPVALTGAGALEADVVAYLQRLSPRGVEPLRLGRTSGLTSAGAEESPLFATVAGAAMRELGGRELRAIGITDAVPAAVRLRRSAYMVPLATASLMFVALMGHNLLMRHQESQFKERRVGIEAQIAERRQELNDVNRLRSRIQETDKRILTLQAQLDYIQQERDRELRATLHLLEGLVRLLPETAALSAIRPISQRRNGFAVTGIGVSPADIQAYALALEQEGVANGVAVRRLERFDASGRAGRRATHRFAIELTAQPNPSSGTRGGLAAHDAGQGRRDLP